MLLAPHLAWGHLAWGQQGEKLFEDYCASCHSVAASAPVMAGPNLAGLLGRRVGSAAGFGYSAVLRDAGARGEVWTAARLRAFLDGPDEMYPGLWMGGTAVRQAAEKDAIASFVAGK
jgi:cytochrome c